MNKTLIIKFLAEGGSAEIYGKKQRGSWRFWQEGNFMDFGELDAINWKHDEHSRLLDAFPESWHRLYPKEINLEFVEEIRKASAEYFTDIKAEYISILEAEKNWDRKFEENIGNLK